MIQLRTVLNVADNSGARKILCVQVKGGSFRKVGTVGDVIVGAVREAAPNGNIKKGDVVKAVSSERKRKFAAETVPTSASTIMLQSSSTATATPREHEFLDL